MAPGNPNRLTNRTDSSVVTKRTDTNRHSRQTSSPAHGTLDLARRKLVTPRKLVTLTTKVGFKWNIRPKCIECKKTQSPTHLDRTFDTTKLFLFVFKKGFKLVYKRTL